MDTVTVYGADWCGDTRATLAHLKDLGLDFQYVNIDESETGDTWVRDQNGGKRKLPTVDVAGLVLSIPADDELDSALEKQGLLT